MIVDHLYLSCRPWNGDRKFRGRIDLAVKYFSDSLTTIHSRLPRIEKCRHIVCDPLHAKRTTGHKNHDCRYSCCIYPFYHLLLKSHKVQIGTVRILTAGLLGPVASEHMFSCHDNIQVAFRSLRYSLVNLCPRHFLRIPSLVHEHEVRLRRDHAETFKDGHTVLRFLRCGPVTHDVVVVCIDSRDKDLFIFLFIKREYAVILEKDYTLACRFKCSLTMFITKTHLHCGLRIRKRLLKKSETELDVEYSSY